MRQKLLKSYIYMNLRDVLWEQQATPDLYYELCMDFAIYIYPWVGVQYPHCV